MATPGASLLRQSPTPLHRSLRLRTMLVVIGVVITPVIFVWLSNSMDARVRDRMRRNVQAAATQAAALSADGRVQVAVERGVWLRSVDPHGVTTLEVDAEAPGSLLERWSLFFFGPDGAPTLQQWDAGAPPIADRPAVALARAGAAAHGCEETEGRKLLVCWAAAHGPGDVVLVQESSRRAIRALYDVRYQVLKLTLFTAGAGLLLGGWLGGQIVRPLERLRDALRERVDSERPTEPIGWTRRDELGELARDIDRLLLAMGERAEAIDQRAQAEAARNQALAAKAAAEAEHARAAESFVADLAHEFKNPVAAIRAAAESLASGAPIDAARAARLARVLSDSGGRLNALLSRLLELARVEAGLPSEARQPVPLDALLSGLVDALRARHERVVVSLDAPPLQLEAVPDRLETALRSVLENAVDAAGPEDPEAWIGVSARLEGDRAVISISDSGPGIAPEDLPRIFDRFFTTRIGQGGTGLGLAMTRAIVRAHGGTIRAASPPGGGAVMTIELPRAEVRS